MDRSRPSPKEAGENDGSLTVAVDRQGIDAYDFKSRAALVRQIKEELGLAEFEPLPSPWTFEIEPTLNCNALCHFCSYEEDIAKFKMLQRENRGQEFGLSKDTVMNLLAALEAGGTTAGTFWSGGGDPLVWSHIVEAIKYAATFSDVSVQTNGISLGKFTRNPEDLAAIRLLTVSVYADNPEQHAVIAGVASFEKVIRNMQRVREIRDYEGLELTLTAKLIVDANNYRTVPQIVRFYRELGVDSVGLRLVQDYNYGGEGQRPVSVELTKEQKQELSDIIATSDYKDSSLNSFGRVVTKSTRKPATTPHCYNAIDGHFACVDAWGNIFTGNPEIGDECFRIGNIIEQPWGEIWKGQRHREIIGLMDQIQRAVTCANTLCRHVLANMGTQEYIDGGRGQQSREAVIRRLGSFL